MLGLLLGSAGMRAEGDAAAWDSQLSQVSPASSSLFSAWCAASMPALPHVSVARPTKLSASRPCTAAHILMYVEQLLQVDGQLEGAHLAHKELVKAILCSACGRLPICQRTRAVHRLCGIHMRQPWCREPDCNCCSDQAGKARIHLPLPWNCL